MPRTRTASAARSSAGWSRRAGRRSGGSTGCGASAELDLSLDTAAGRANVLAAELHARNPAASPFGGRLFVAAN